MSDQLGLDFATTAPPRRRERRRHSESGGQAAERAGRAADPDWMIAAINAVKTVASRQPTFTTDDVWALLANSGQETPEGRAMGAVMRRAAKEGIASTTEPPEYRPSVRSECHGRPVRVWKIAHSGQQSGASRPA